MRAAPFALLTTFVLFGVHDALAAGAAKCDQFVAVSEGAFTMVQGHPNCGLDPNDPRWRYPPSQDHQEYARFCRGALDDTIDQLTQQITDATSRCRVCSARAEQCAVQDHLARVFHCGPLTSENEVCDAILGRPTFYKNNDGTLSGVRSFSNAAEMTKECVDAAFSIDYSGPLININSGGGILFNSAEDYDSAERKELSDRNRELDQCEVSKKDQINFCDDYVHQTRKARTIATGCKATLPSDGRFSPTDDDRMFWCMGLIATPGGDPNFKMGDGKDPVAYLEDVLKPCHARKVLTSTRITHPRP